MARRNSAIGQGPVFSDVFAEADKAGRTAAKACRPTPVVVQYRGRVWTIPDGYYGWAWVTIHPGNSAIARYAKKHLGAERGYRGGVQLSVRAYGFSWERKQAFAEAFADVLSNAGYEAYAHDLLD